MTGTRDTSKATRQSAINRMIVKDGSIVINAYVSPKQNEPEGHIANNYWVSSAGHIYSYSKRANEKKPSMKEIMTEPSEDGYYHGSIEYKNSMRHRFIWFSFIKAYFDGVVSDIPKFFGFDPADYDQILARGINGAPEDQIVIHHINHDKNDNRLDNLEAIPKDVHEQFHRMECAEDIEAYEKYKKENPDKYFGYWNKILTRKITDPTIIIFEDGEIKSSKLVNKGEIIVNVPVTEDQKQNVINTAITLQAERNE